MTTAHPCQVRRRALGATITQCRGAIFDEGEFAADLAQFLWREATSEFLRTDDRAEAKNSGAIQQTSQTRSTETSATRPLT